jgi:hypothetical protein
MSDKNKKTLKKGLNRLKDLLDKLTNRNKHEPVPAVVWKHQHDRRLPHQKF